jgi:excinuclease ABC subunit B
VPSIKRLTDMQYERNDMDFQRGAFRVRGDIIDIFPAEHAEHAVRVSLFDDEDRGLAVFRPADRPSPAQGAALHGFSGFALCDATRRPCCRAIEAIKDELRDRAYRFFVASNNKLVEAQRIEQRTRFDLELLDQIGFCKGIENYSRHFSGRKAGEAPPTLIDYLPSDAH